MTPVKILGVGCSKCRALEGKVRDLIRDLISKNYLQAEVIKVEDIQELKAFSLHFTKQ